MRKAPAVELRNSQKRGHGTKSGRTKEIAIAALLTQRNVEKAARVARIGTQTLYRWMKETSPEGTER
jgi:transcriptional regulator with PAS, ATPase and Fis domain